MGGVRRLLKTGEYYDLKPWVTGGPYAAVYLTGIKGATRGRKKCYVHKLVADHFVPGKANNKVVHHTVGPHSNTKNTLQWVTPSENNKARRFFTDDGKRKVKNVAAKKIPKKNVPAPAAPKKPAPARIKKAEPKREVAKVQKPDKRLPDDPNEFFNAPTFLHKLTYLHKNWPPMKKAWKEFRLKVRSVNQKNFEAKFREATGKTLKMGKSPQSWYTRIISAMYEIERRLEE